MNESTTDVNGPPGKAELTAGLSERVAEVVKSSGLTLRDFARQAGIAASALAQYLPNDRGGRVSKPTLEAVTRIARAGFVSVEWLATGNDPQPLDAATLREAIFALETILSETKRKMSASHKAELIVELYLWFREEGKARRGTERRAKVLSLVKAFVARG